MHYAHFIRFLGLQLVAIILPFINEYAYYPFVSIRVLHVQEEGVSKMPQKTPAKNNKNQKHKSCCK